MTLEEAIKKGLSVEKIAKIVDLSASVVQEVIDGTAHRVYKHRVEQMLALYDGPTQLYMWIQPRKGSDNLTPIRANSIEEAEQQARKWCEKEGVEFHGHVIKWPANHIHIGPSPIDKGGLF